MKLEAWPGGRWFRDLGDGNGHLWGHRAGDQAPDTAGDYGAAVHVVCGRFEHAIPAERREGRDADQVSPQGVGRDSRKKHRRGRDDRAGLTCNWRRSRSAAERQ